MTTKDRLNSRQHLFVLNLLAGMNQTEAYIKAGYLPDGAAQNASLLLINNHHVKAFYERKLALLSSKTLALVEKTIMQPTEIKQRLSTLARANLVDFLDATGQPSLTRDTPNHQAATEYYHRHRVDSDGNPIITKNIKLVNPIEPLRELARMHGMYAPSKHLVGHVSLVNKFVDRKRIDLEEENPQ